MTPKRYSKWSAVFLCGFVLLGVFSSTFFSVDSTRDLNPQEANVSAVSNSIWCDIKGWFNFPCELEAPDNYVVIERKSTDPEYTELPASVIKVSAPVITGVSSVSSPQIIREVIVKEGQLDSATYVTRDEYGRQITALQRSIESVNQNTSTTIVQSGGGSSDVSSIEDLSDVASMTEVLGDLLTWNGTTWTNIATSSLGIVGGSGLTSLNGQTGVTQSFATSSSGGLNIAIASSGDTHTFTTSLTSGYSIPLTASSTEWSTAFGWGNHASAGYLTAIATTTVRNLLSASTGLSYSTTTGAFTNTGVLSIGTLTGAVSTSTLGLPTFSDLGSYFTLSAWNSTTTDALSEGSTNLYFTNARARDTLSSSATGLSYATSTGVFSLTSGYVIPLTASTTEWATAYGWGDHSSGGYLTSESDPVFIASDAFNITSASTTAWNNTTNGVNASSTEWGTAYTLANLLNSASSTWNLAYASTTALTPAYMRGLFSSSVTGLTYNSSTGATSLTAGYTIPLTASTTEWSNKVSSQWTTSGSDIYYNTGNVGIGTASPVSKLSLGVVSNSGTKTYSTNSQGGFDTYYDTGDSTRYFDIFSNGAPNGSAGGSVMRFMTTANTASTYAVERMRIDSSGNVGIGTTTPSTKLTVAGGAIQTNAGTNASGVDHFNLASSGGLRRWSIGLDEVDTGSGNAGSDFFIKSFSDAGTGVRVPLTILRTNGNVGIGTSTPESLLHLYSSSGAAIIEDTNSAAILALRNTTANPSANTELGRVNLQGLSSAGGVIGYAQIRGYVSSNTSGSEDGYLTFLNYTSGSLSEKMRITSSGNVGIGTTTPTSLLHTVVSTNNGDSTDSNFLTIQSINRSSTLELIANSSFNSIVRFGDANNTQVGRIQYSHTDDSMEFFTNGTSMLTINSSGNVGIGTTTPSAKLSITSTGGTTPYLYLERTGPTHGVGFIVGGPSSTYGLRTQIDGTYTTYQSANGGISIGTSYSASNDPPTDGAIIQGNVGIGSTTPSAKLAVVGTAGNNAALRIASSTGASMLSIAATGNATFVGSGGTCTINGSGACSSDERLKTGFKPLENKSALDNLMTLRTGTYYWKDTAWDQNENVGVLAQDILAVYPQLVGTAESVYKGKVGTYYTVNYAGLTVPIIASIKELNLKLESLATTTTFTNLTSDSFTKKFFNKLIAWFGDVGNGVGTMFATVFRASEMICVDNECLTAEDVRNLKSLSGNSSQNNSGGSGDSANSPPEEEIVEDEEEVPAEEDEVVEVEEGGEGDEETIEGVETPEEEIAEEPIAEDPVEEVLPEEESTPIEESVGGLSGN